MNIITHLKIEKLVLHGYGLGYYHDKTVFVPYSIPNDIVNVQVRLEKKDIIFADIIEIIQPAKQRQSPFCEAFGEKNACGGCDWLILPYYLQLKWKSQIIKEIFSPICPNTAIQSTKPSPKPLYYRNKSFLPVGLVNNTLYFGLYERFSHKVVPHQTCFLHPPIFTDIINELTNFFRKIKLQPYDEIVHKGSLRHVGLRINNKQDSILLILVTKSSKLPFSNLLVKQLITRFPQIIGIIQNINPDISNVILGNKSKVIYGQPYLVDSLLEKRFQVHYNSFFQVNHSVAELLLSHLKSYLSSDDIVLDAYCGTGSISLSIADKVKQVIGVEEFDQAVKDADDNRLLNNITNASFFYGKVEDLINFLTAKYDFSTVIFDPPRKGLDKSVLECLSYNRIPQLIYISCNPMTLARDIKLLQTIGYSAQEIVPFDMFPQTWHIETMVRLTL